MPSSVFLDTNGWIPLLNATEYMHERANNEWLGLGLRGYRILLTDWIIAETGNGLARSREKERFAESVERFWQSPVVEIVTVDRQLIAQAIHMYRTYMDKSWGLVDCTSFVIMQENGITHAFTSDRHFEQAGFTCLLPLQ